MAWHFEKISTCWNFQTYTSKFIMIQAPNGKVLNIKVFPLDLSFPKSPNSFILGKVWGVCAWLKQGCINLQDSCFKCSNKFALPSKLHVDLISVDCGPSRVASWAYTRPCEHVHCIANFGSIFKCANNTHLLL